MLESLNYSFRNPKNHNLSNLPHQTVEKLQKNHGVLWGPQLDKKRWRARLGILRVKCFVEKKIWFFNVFRKRLNLTHFQIIFYLYLVAILSYLLPTRHGIILDFPSIFYTLFFFTFNGPCIVKYMPIIVQQDATIYNLFISVNLSTCFGSPSGAHVTVPTASGISETVTATCYERDWTGTQFPSSHVHDRFQLRFR